MLLLRYDVNAQKKDLAMRVCCAELLVKNFILVLGLFYIVNTETKIIQLSRPQSQKVDLIIFSFDRPMQLYALLESCEYYLTGIENIVVIYRSSNERFADGYISVQNRFSKVQFLQQGTEPFADFKPLVLRAFYAGASAYVLFAVDDIIVKNSADLTVCTRTLEEQCAYGFYLRLATHIDYCYAENQPQAIPHLKPVNENILSWIFAEGQLDWHYPNTVDMTIYRKSNIEKELKNICFKNPNTLEAAWAARGHQVMNCKGLCFNNSIVVNIPINIVQSDYQNRCIRSYTPEQLLELFEKGYRLDFLDLKGVKNKSCHMDYELKFVLRGK